MTLIRIRVHVKENAMSLRGDSSFENEYRIEPGPRVVSKASRLRNAGWKSATRTAGLGSNEFPGEITGGETPDPIPNSEAKPVPADGSRFAARVGDCQEFLQGPTP